VPSRPSPYGTLLLSPPERELPRIALEYLREVLDGGGEPEQRAHADAAGAQPVLPWDAGAAPDDPAECARRREWSRRWRRLRLADAVAEYGRALESAATPDQVYTAVPEHAARIVGAWTGLLFVPGEAGGPRTLPDGRLRTRADRLRIPVLRRRTRVGARQAGRAGGRFAALAPLFADDGAAALACIPFGRGGALVLVERRHDREFDEDDWSLLAMVAAQGQAALERVHAAGRVAELAGTDPVTKLAGAGHVDRVLEHAWQVVPMGRPLSVVLLGLDGLGGARARFGGASAERLLRAAVEALREALPPEGTALRCGAAELLLVLPGATPAQAAAVVTSLRARLSLPLHLHAGIAGDHHGARGPADLLRTVRAALPPIPPGAG
jgi:GGDEF domain-containing protein